MALSGGDVRIHSRPVQLRRYSDCPISSSAPISPGLSCGR